MCFSLATVQYFLKLLTKNRKVCSHFHTQLMNPAKTPSGAKRITGSPLQQQTYHLLQTDKMTQCCKGSLSRPSLHP